jgi:hypothetical protein
MALKIRPQLNTFKGGELSPRLAGRNDIGIYWQGCSELTNMLVYQHGGVTKRPGSYYISTAGDYTKDVRLIPFQYSTEQAYFLEFGDQYMRVYKDGGQVQTASGTAYEISTPYEAEDLDLLRYAQTADTMYITHTDYKTRKITRYGHTNWIISEVDFTNGPFEDENETDIALEPSAVSGTISLAAKGGSVFNSNHVGALFKISATQEVSTTISGEDMWSDTFFVDANETIIASMEGSWGATVTVQKTYDEGDTWIDYLSSTSNTNVEIAEIRGDVYYRIGIDTGDYTSGAAELRLSKLDQYGYVKITQYINPTVVYGTVERELPTTETTTRWAEGSWSDSLGWPETVAFYEQRLLCGGNYNNPQAIWASKVNSYEDFDIGTASESDAYTYYLVSQDVNSIRWMVPSDVLRIGTHGGEWRFGDKNEATTPTSVDTKRQSTTGSEAVQAVLIGNVVLFIQRGGTKLRSMAYDYQTESYLTPEVSILAEHIVKEGIKEIHFQALPDPMIWLVLDTGDIAVCTYDSLQDIKAFTRLTTNGSYKSLAIIPGSDRDEVWTVVERTVNDIDYKFIEQFQSTEYDTIADAFYLDSGLTYTGTGATTLSGLDHLEGEEVYVVAEGGVLPTKTVVSGSVSLTYPTTKAHVGYKYDGVIETMNLLPLLQGSSPVGSSARAHRLALFVKDTNYVKVGPEGKEVNIKFRTTDHVMGEPVPLQSNLYTVSYPEGFNKTPTVRILSDVPLPMTILNLAPIMNIGDN